MYCVYTDDDVPENEGNWDHVFPLSLGGLNQFTVWAELDINSKMGSEVDGPLASDPLMALGLGRSPVKGHGKKVQPRWRRATVAGRPAQVAHTAEGMKFWDAVDRRSLAEDEVIGQEITAQFSIGAYTGLRFLAKVALGGGYFIYGDALLKAIDCASLRKLIMLDVDAAKTDAGLLGCGVQICDRFHKDALPGGSAYLYRVLCEQLPRSVFIAEPYANGIAFHAGVVGQYVGTIFCPGDTKEIPVEGDLHARGHVILLGPEPIERCSFEAFLLDFQKALSDEAISRGSEEDG